MQYIIKEYYRKIPDKVLIRDLRKIARKLNKKWVTSIEYDRHGKYTTTTMLSHFGRWNTALLKAGLKIQYHRNATRENLMQNLKYVWDKLSRQPKMMEMQKPLSEHSYAVYSRKYGNWIKSLIAFSKWVHKGKKVKVLPALKDQSIKKKFKKRRRIQDGTRYKVLKRDKFKCVLCGRSPVTDPKIILHIDHIIPVSKGGRETMKNLRTLCSKCNIGKMTGN